MRLRVFTPFLLLSIVLCIPAVADSSGDEIVGKWYTDDNKSQVEVAKQIGADGKTKYFGTLVWFENPTYEKGDPEEGARLHDRENPDEDRQNDPLLGLNLLKNFVYNADDNSWDSGTIYDPEVGKTYKCVINFLENDDVADPNTLNVRGYIGIPTFGRTTAWVRVTEENQVATE